MAKQKVHSLDTPRSCQVGRHRWERVHVAGQRQWGERCGRCGEEREAERGKGQRVQGLYLEEPHGPEHVNFYPYEGIED